MSGEHRYGCSKCLSVFRLEFAKCPIDGNPLEKLEHDPLIGTTIADRYQIEACVGEGGMGRVYRARHNRVSRLFAIKILFGDLATDSVMRARFAREAEAASRLSHPNVISVTDFGESKEGLLYLAMDFVEGPELGDAIRQDGPFATQRVRDISKQLCLGLEHAHEEGLVHRDFKGANVILAKRGEVETPRIVDFGIAVMLEDTDERLTTQGLIIGTPAYMSPEQATGKDLDARSDLFSLGVLMYEMLAGVLPFDGDPMAMAMQNLSSKAPPIANRVPGLDVDPVLESIAHKLMSKRPRSRYQSAAEVLAAMDAKLVVANRLDVEVTESIQEQRDNRAFIPLGLLLLGGIGVTALMFGGGDDKSPNASNQAPVADAGRLAKVSQTDASNRTKNISHVENRPADAAPTTAVDSTETGKTETGKTVPTKKPPKNDAKAAVVTKPKIDPKPEPKIDPKPKPEPEPEPKVLTPKALTALYQSVGEAINDLPDSAQLPNLRSQYSAIPFQDALRVPTMRAEVESKLRRLARAAKTLKPTP